MNRWWILTVQDEPMINTQSSRWTDDEYSQFKVKRWWILTVQDEPMMNTHSSRWSDDEYSQFKMNRWWILTVRDEPMMNTHSSSDTCQPVLVSSWRITTLNWNTHLQQYRTITNPKTFKAMTLKNETPDHLLPFLIFYNLKTRYMYNSLHSIHF